MEFFQTVYGEWVNVNCITNLFVTQCAAHNSFEVNANVSNVSLPVVINEFHDRPEAYAWLDKFAQALNKGDLSNVQIDFDD